jgi:hypothetical protein
MVGSTRTDEKRLSQADKNRLLRQSFSMLVDSIRDAQRMSGTEARLQEIEDTNEEQLSALEKLQVEISRVVLSFQDPLGKELTDSVEKQVTSLSTVSIELAKRKIQEKHSLELKENQRALDTEKTKTFKSVEAFLAIPPFIVLERTISVTLLGGVYVAVARYSCADNIQFDFSLDCNKNPALDKKFRAPSSPEEKVKIPIVLGKSFLKKEPSADYEDLDSYVLSSAEVTDISLTAALHNAGKSSTIKIIDSKRDSLATLTVEYSTPDTKITVTSEPTLIKFLNTEQTESASDSLWRSILELERFKIGLLRVVSDGHIVYAEDKLTDVQKFLAKAWKIIEPKVEAAIGSKNASAGEDVSSPDPEGSLDETFVRQKIAPLGSAGDELLASLKLS